MAETHFRHSTARVPRLYKDAGKIVQKVKEERASFKGLLYQCNPRQRTKALYALVAETLRHGSELDELLRRSQLLIKEPRLDPWVARVLMVELLWRQRPLSGPAIPFKIVKNYESELRSALANLSHDVAQPVHTRRPRFVRINTLKVLEHEVVEFLAQEGWHGVRESADNYKKSDDEKYANFLQKISSLSDNEFLHDMHVPNLLLFPSNMEFYNLEYYRSSGLILQDKASCMPAFLLNPHPGSTVLDMCAAPGMKTTHVAAILNNMGTVYAIEKNAFRYKTLCKIVSEAGATCVKPISGDALHFTDKELPDVEYILVDPSCSGSGMTNREDIFNDSIDVSKERLEKLSGFQCVILRHAMTNFPKVKRIVYSTCSTSVEENEAVIQDVLSSTAPNFKLVMPSIGTHWMKRGSSSYSGGEFGLYTRPEVDMTIGFFVAVFERTDNDYVPGTRIVQEVSSEETSRKKKKKKLEKAPSQTENSCVSEPIRDSTLERMMKAMSNVSDAVENNLNSDTQECSKTREEKSAKKKKKKKRNEADDEDVYASVPVAEDPLSEAGAQECFKTKEEKSAKKKKKRNEADNVDVSLLIAENPLPEPVKKRRKKSKA